MIPQPFVKGSSERVFFGPYEYPAGADLIFDFGNPICTSAFNSSRIVYNVGTQNITASLIPFNSPGPIYPALSTNNGGYAEFSDGQNYMQWDWKSTELQSNVFVYAPRGNQSSGGNQFFPKISGASSIEVQIVYPNNRLFVNIKDSSNNKVDFAIPQIQFVTGSLNGRNGWNTFVVTANSGSQQALYTNTNSSSFGTDVIPRTTSAIQTTLFPQTSNSNIMAFLQYPKILTQKEIRQINKVFGQRYFT